MHPNPNYRKAEAALNIAFAQERAFGVLAVNAEPAPLISHIPFQVSEDGTRIEAHLVRSNPIARMLSTPRDVVIAVTGADGYISPDWYGIADQVPTWNYVAVHLRGQMRLMPDAALRGVLERLSAEMERRLLPKTAWLIDKVSDDALAKLMRQIVPVEMDVSAIDGTWKLGQNKTDDVRVAAAARLGEDGFGAEVAQLAAWMDTPPA